MIDPAQLTDDQRKVLGVVLESFQSNTQWPTYRWLNQIVFVQLGLEFDPLYESMPSGFVLPNPQRRVIAVLPPDNPIKLTLRALVALGEGDAINVFLGSSANPRSSPNRSPCKCVLCAAAPGGQPHGCPLSRLPSALCGAEQLAAALRQPGHLAAQRVPQSEALALVAHRLGLRPPPPSPPSHTPAIRRPRGLGPIAWWLLAREHL
jgi:hypothetical protein